jgi:flagellar biosynthetic protein FliQ
MTPELALDLFRQAIYVVLLCVTVLILPGLLVGLLVAMFQATTQINESSLGFIPKFVVTLITLVLAGPWLIRTLIDYSHSLISDTRFIG